MASFLSYLAMFVGAAFLFAAGRPTHHEHSNYLPQYERWNDLPSSTNIEDQR